MLDVEQEDVDALVGGERREGTGHGETQPVPVKPWLLLGRNHGDVEVA